MLPFLAERGWLADVITLPAATMHEPDPARLSELPSGTRIYPVPLREPTWVRALRGIKARWPSVNNGPGRVAGESDPSPSHLRDPYHGVSLTVAECLDIRHPSLRVRLNMRLERDRAALWASDVNSAVDRECLATNAVVTSGPPHFAHMAGRRVAAAGDSALVLDLRDPWASNPAHGAGVGCRPYIEWLRYEEGLAVAQARWIVGNTVMSTDRIRQVYPAWSEKCATVWNGADGDPAPAADRDARPFRLAYAGAIYAGRTPATTFAALQQVVTRLGLTPNDIRFDLMGDVELVGAVPTMTLAREAGIERFVHLHAPGTREDARAFLRGAHMLVSLPWPGRDQVPAKIYEYADFSAWMLVLADSDTAPAARLEGTSAMVVDPGNVAEIAGAILKAYQRHLGGERPSPVNAEGQLSRAREANTFADLLDQATRNADHANGA